jgi:hypothetical protein
MPSDDVVTRHIFDLAATQKVMQVGGGSWEERSQGVIPPELLELLRKHHAPHAPPPAATARRSTPT